MCILFVYCFPTPSQQGVEAILKLHRQLNSLAFPVQGDGLANVIDHHLAGVATSHVLLEFFANGRVHSPIHIFIQQSQ